MVGVYFEYGSELSIIIPLGYLMVGPKRTQNSESEVLSKVATMWKSSVALEISSEFLCQDMPRHKS
jgi:hypothetical protein